MVTERLDLTDLLGELKLPDAANAEAATAH